MDEHLHYMTIAIGALGALQALGIFLFTIIWQRLGKIDDDMRKHHEDYHAHGNGMPRPEVESKIAALSAQVAAISFDARRWMDENSAAHERISDRLDSIVDLLMKGKP